MENQCLKVPLLVRRAHSDTVPHVQNGLVEGDSFITIFF